MKGGEKLHNKGEPYRFSCQQDLSVQTESQTPCYFIIWVTIFQEEEIAGYFPGSVSGETELDNTTDQKKLTQLREYLQKNLKSPSGMNPAIFMTLKKNSNQLTFCKAPLSFLWP